MIFRLALCALLTGLVAAPAHAQPVWQSSQTAVGTGNAVVNRPASAASGDLLVVGLMVEKGSGETIAAPADWNLIRRTNNGSDVGMATYYKIATGSEPASYTFTIANGSKWAIGISRVTGADGTTPIDVHGGQTGTSSPSVTAPSVTTTVANTLVLAFYTNKKAATYTAAGGTTERYDVPNSAGGLPSNMIATFTQASAGATPARTATASDPEFWVGQQVAIRPGAGAVTPGSFNAFETTTAGGAITGVVKTKVAGSAFSLDVVAIASGAQLNTFTNTVTVELLGNNTLGVALDANNCPTSFTTLQTVSPNPTISTGRSTVNFAAVANAWRDVRVRIRYPTSSPTVTSCSTNNFAIRPNAFANVALTDATWDTAGTTRTLNNTIATGGVVHKAGRPFTLRADALNAASAITTNYALMPDASVLSDCGASTACPGTFGTLAIGASFSAGQLNSTAASYSEVGSFTLQLVDDDFASVDNADSSAPEREIRSGTLNVGRFVPDHFAFTNPGTPQFRTFDTASCAGRSFTYVGQPFGYVTVPTARVEARNAAGAITANYAGSLFKLVGASLSQTYGMTGKTITPSLQTAVLSGSGAGFATYTAHANDKIAFNRDATSASAPFNAAIALTWIAEDSSENAAGQGIITTSPSFVFNAIGFDAGAEFRYGRLRLANANGSQLANLPVLMELQYANSVGAFITNAADSCTSIASQAVAMTFTPNLVPSPNCKTLLSGGGQFSSGRRTLVLSAPGNGNQGAATLAVNLNGAGATTTCTVAGVPAAAQNAAQPWLQGNWTTPTFTQDASARATFGAFPGAGEVIFIRENF